MKVAVCLIGMIGGKSGKYGLNQSSDVLQLGYKQYKKHIFDNNDVDVFCHSSSVDFKDEIIKTYKPKKYLFIPEPHFNIPSHVTGSEERKRAHYHMWFSYRTVNLLRKDYEKETGQKYDFVYTGRYDVAWQTDVNFSELSQDKFYAGYWNRIFNNKKAVPNYLWHSLEKDLVTNGKLTEKQKEKGYDIKLVGYPFNDEGLIDRWFISNPDNMDKFSTLFEYLNEYTLPNKKWNKDNSVVDSAGTISNHRLAPTHLERLGLLDKLELKFYTHDDFPLVRRLYFKNK